MFLSSGCVCANWAKYWTSRNCRKIVFQTFTTSSPSKVRSKNTNRFKTRRPGHTALLERFVKHTSMDGSLIARTPFNLKCSASFFDSEGNVDSARNYSVGVQRDESNKLEKINRRKETRQEIEEDILGDVQTKTGADTGQNNGAGKFLEMEDISLMRDVSEVEMKILDNLANKTTQDMVDNINTRARTPLHMCLYGRTSHRVDSYSIMAGKLSHTHVYISDATTTEEALSMFNLDSSTGPTSVTPSGSVSIWKPREISQVEIGSGVWDGTVPEEVASSVKVYCPSHILDQQKNGITTVFNTPTLMNKIYLEAEKQGSIDLNCNLMDQLVSVGLVTQSGNIRVKDVWAEEIRLATSTGDILCYGAVEGDITVETAGDGDFIARSVVGPRLRVTTLCGDICLYDDCHAEVSVLHTLFGNIHCRKLYGTAEILIKEQGTANINIVSGSVTAVVKSGDIIAHIDTLTEDSYLEVETGNVIIHVVPDFPFRICLMAARTSISPHILNSGEFFLSGGLENFVSGIDTSRADLLPSITVRCHSGLVTLQGARSSKSQQAGADSS